MTHKINLPSWTLPAVLWLVFVLVLAGSFTHTQWLFALREPGSRQWIAYLIAAGIDLGIAGATAALHKRRGKRWFLRLVLLLCTGTSIYANWAHALTGGTVEPTWRAIATAWGTDALPLVTSLIVSVPLPVLTLAIAETLVGDLERAEKKRVPEAVPVGPVSVPVGPVSVPVGLVRVPVGPVPEALATNEPPNDNLSPMERARRAWEGDAQISLRELAVLGECAKSTAGRWRDKWEEETARQGMALGSSVPVGTGG